MKRCSRCREQLPTSAFNCNRAKRDGLSDQCRACRSEYRLTRPKPVGVVAHNWAARVAEVEWLAGTDTPENVAVRAGWRSFASMERALSRHGRYDLVKAVCGREAVAA